MRARDIGRPAIIGTAAELQEVVAAYADAGHPDEGWLAQKGRVPLGYLGDADKTAGTFPVIDGTRYSEW